MKTNGLKMFVYLFVLVLASSFVLADSIDSLSVSVTPTTPTTDDTLTCTYKVVGNSSSYTVDVDWKKGSTVVKDIDPTSVNNNTDATAALASSETDVEVEYTCEVTATGSDGVSKTSTASNTITNRVPVISSLSKTSANIGANFDGSVSASDPDGKTLSYSLTSGVVGNMKIGSTTGVFSWTPTTVGTFPVAVQVSDGSKTASQTFNIVVGACVKLTDVEGRISGSGDEDVDFNENTGSVSGGFDPEPGDTVTLEFELENFCDDDSDMDSECNIDVQLEELCDDCDDQDDDKDLDVDTEADETETFTFDVPFEANEENHEVEVKITCDDDGGEQNYEVFNNKISFNVEKQNDELWIRELALSPSLVSCVRNPTLTVDVVNIGSRDQNTELAISNQELGIQINEFFKLEEGDVTDDDDTHRRKSYKLNIDETVKPGAYQINVKTYYDANSEIEEDFVTLTIQECGTSSSSSSSKDSNDNDKEEQSTTKVVTVPTNTQTTTSAPTKATTTTTTTPKTTSPTTTTSSGSLLGSTGYVVAIIVAIIVVLGLIAFLVVVAFRK